MINFMAFLSALCSWFIKYVVYIVAVVIAVFGGITIRKSIDSKKATVEETVEKAE